MNINKVSRVDIMKLPDYAYMRGVASKDIVQIRLLSTKEKKARKWGEPDVEVKSVWFRHVAKGGEYITRKEANERFYMPDGRKLSTNFLRANQKYMVTADLGNIPVYVLAPSGKNVIYTVNGKDLPNNMFLVFVMQNNNILFSCPIILKKDFFMRMVVLKETPKDVVARVRRYDTATEDRKDAQYRVVAVALDKATFKKVGYIVSFKQENGGYKEQLCTMKNLVTLLESNNIRNMKIVKDLSGKRKEELTYGRLIELPTHFVQMNTKK